jgi:putative transposase
MTDTIGPVDGLGEQDKQELAQRLVDQAREQGVDLVGPGGLLTGLTKTVLETALEQELSEHLGYAKHDPAGDNSGNSRNGTRSKTVLTEVGPVEIAVPRDRDGSFTPAIVRKRQRRLDGVDQLVLSLTARGLTPHAFEVCRCLFRHSRRLPHLRHEPASRRWCTSLDEGERDYD